MSKNTTTRAFARRPPENLRNIRVILVEPQTPGNIGSTARAMKTMGLTHLTLVRPVPYRDVDEAWNFAHGAHDVLETARVCDSLDEAIGDLTLLAGTTNRRRIGVLPDMMTAREAGKHLVEASQSGRAGILFGREDCGLSTVELSHCQVVATIPAAAGMPSLNLSHAVQVVCYEIFQASLGTMARKTADLAEIAEQEALIQRINSLILSLGFTPFKDDPQSFALTLRRVFGRAGMERRDVRALHKLIATLQRSLRPQAADPLTDE